MDIKEQRNRIKDEIRRHMTDYLEDQGIDTSKNFSCLNPEHEDSNPSMSFLETSDRVYCHGCGKTYDLLDLIGIEYGITDYNEQLRTGCFMYGLTYPEKENADTSGQTDRRKNNKSNTTMNLSKPNDSTPEPAGPPAAAKSEPKLTDEELQSFFDISAAGIDGTDYLKKRGISDETAAAFGVGYCQDWKHPDSPKMHASKRLIIPTSDRSYVARAIDPETPEKYRFMKYGEVHLFNQAALTGGTAAVYIVEGEIDALSIAEVGGAAIALGSTSNANKLIQAVKDTPPTAPLILALDNDEAGAKATQHLAEELSKIPNVTFAIYSPQGEAKDPNDALQADQFSFTEAVMKGEIDVQRLARETGKLDARTAYQETSAAHHLDAFVRDIEKRAVSPAIPTGFPELDARLGGGLHPELIIMGAVSSLGKTTLLLQIADQIAARGHDVLYFSLEMSRYELMAKSISRHTAIIGARDGIDQGHWKTNRGITSGDKYAKYNNTEKELIRAAMTNYKKSAEHLYINESLGDIHLGQLIETVRNHEQMTGRPPAIVMIDYLQIVPPIPSLKSTTDKQNTDAAVFALKRLSRELNIPIIAIASFNRENYKAEVSMQAFKESGAIEYTSDLLIGLQFDGVGGKGKGKEFDIKTAMNESPRRIELVILKNRNGERGDPIRFEYLSRFNLFSEAPPEGFTFDEEPAAKRI